MLITVSHVSRIWACFDNLISCIDFAIIHCNFQPVYNSGVSEREKKKPVDSSTWSRNSDIKKSLFPLRNASKIDLANTKSALRNYLNLLQDMSNTDFLKKMLLSKYHPWLSSGRDFTNFADTILDDWKRPSPFDMSCKTGIVKRISSNSRISQISSRSHF